MASKIWHKIAEKMKDRPLSKRLLIPLMMVDYDNWDNGEYKGDLVLIEKQIEVICSTVDKWVSDGMPTKKQDSQTTK